jgi:glycerol-3-phosphate acyltransferase PlsY
MGRNAKLPAPVVVIAAYVIGSVPFSGLLARRLRGVDLRKVGSGTVSGTGLFRVAGMGPLMLGGVLDLAKGSVGPLLAGRSRPGVQTAAGAAGVVGHNWSMFLDGAGGRGISTAMGAMLVTAPEGSGLMLAGLALGRATRATSLGAFVSYLALVPLLSRTRGRRGFITAVSLVMPMLLKRVTGNRPPVGPARRRAYLNRLVFDEDEARWPGWLCTTVGARP